MLDTPRGDLAARVREQVPNAVVIRARLPEQQSEALEARPEAPSPLFETYYTSQRGNDPSEALMTAFDTVYARAAGEFE